MLRESAPAGNWTASPMPCRWATTQHGCVCVSVCLCMCPDNCIKRPLTCWFVLTLSRSNLKVKVRGQSSRSQDTTQLMHMLYRESTGRQLQLIILWGWTVVQKMNRITKQERNKCWDKGPGRIQRTQQCLFTSSRPVVTMATVFEVLML